MKARINEEAPTFAQWETKPHYTYTFNPGTGGSFDPLVFDMYEGQEFNIDELPETVSSEPHYEFARWEPVPVTEPVTQNKTFTSVHNYIAATVHFNTNGGEGISDIEVDKNSKITIDNPRHKDGVFVGWYSDSGLTTTVDFSSWTMPDPAVETTFYTKWDKEIVKRIVSYVVNGGTASFSTVTKVLRDADGWASTSGSFTLTEADVPVVTPDSSHKLPVTWTPQIPLGAVMTDNVTFTGTLAKAELKIFFDMSGAPDATFIPYRKETQYVVSGEAIEEVSIRGKVEFEVEATYNYDQKYLDVFNINGLNAKYENKSRIIVNGVPTAHTTIQVPNPEVKGYWLMVFVANGVTGELVGEEFTATVNGYTITEPILNNGIDNAIFDIGPNTKVTVHVRDIPDNYVESPSLDVDYNFKGDDDERAIIKLTPKVVPEGNFFIDQTVTGTLGDQNDIFGYTLSTKAGEFYPSTVKTIYAQGTTILRGLTVPVGHIYTVKEIYTSDADYVRTMTNDTGTMGDGKTTTYIRQLKGKELNNGGLVHNINVLSWYQRQNPETAAVSDPTDPEINPDSDRPNDLLRDDEMACTIRLSEPITNDDWTNGICAHTWQYIDGGNPYTQTFKNLPTCTYTTEIDFSIDKAAYTHRFFRIGGQVSGQIMNTTTTTANVTVSYPTGNLKVHTYNATNTNRTVTVHLFYPDGTPFDDSDTFGAASFNGNGTSSGVINAMIENTFTLERIPTGWKYKVTLDDLAYDPNKITLTTQNVEGVIGEDTEITADFRCIEVVGEFNFASLTVSPPEGGWGFSGGSNFLSFQTVMRFNQPIPEDIGSKYEVFLERSDPESQSSITGTMNLADSVGYSGIRYNDNMVLPSEFMQTGIPAGYYYVYTLILRLVGDESGAFKHKAVYHIPIVQGSTEDVVAQPVELTALSPTANIDTNNGGKLNINSGDRIKTWLDYKIIDGVIKE